MAKRKSSSVSGLSGMLPRNGLSREQVVPIPPQIAWMQAGVEAWHYAGERAPQRVRIADAPRRHTSTPDSGRWKVKWVDPADPYQFPVHSDVDSVFPNRVDALEALERSLRSKADTLVRRAAKIRQEISELLGGT